MFGPEKLFFGEESPQDALRRKAEKKYQESLRNQNLSKRERRSNEDEVKVSRRDFLKLSALGIGAFATGYKVGEKAREIAEKAGWVDKEKDVDEKEQTIEAKNEIVSEEIDLTEEELKEFEFGEITLEDEDLEMMKNVLSPDIKKKFEINLEVAGVITKYWIHAYQNKERPGLERARNEMQEIDSILRSQFSRYGVPEEFRYLAIPESGWKKVKSKAGAEGYYQFMPKTAKMYGLRDPYNPLESAAACARLLKDLHDETGDWDLALAGYNGGFIWDYIKKCRREKSHLNYPGFLKMIEQQINSERMDILNSKVFFHSIRKRKNGSVESLWYLAQKYHVSVEEIKRINPSSGAPLEKSIYVGKKINIPSNEKNRQIRYNEKIAGFMENIQYPPKFNAVIEALEIRPAQYVSRERIDLAKN